MRSNFTVEETDAILAKHYPWAGDKFMKRWYVFVDGVNKGEVFKHANGCWYWRRQNGVEPFPKRFTLDDVADWARKCCRGKEAKVRAVKDYEN